MEERLNRVKQQLQQSSYKLTPQREATLRVLIENEKDHLSAEDVYLKVKDRAPEIGLATVYRTLELLAELKVVDKMNLIRGHLRSRLPALFLRYGAFISLRLERNMQPKTQPY